MTEMKREARHWVPDALWDVREDALSTEARTVYGAIARCVSKGIARPSTAQLARMTASSTRTVSEVLAPTHIRSILPSVLSAIKRRTRATRRATPR